MTGDEEDDLGFWRGLLNAVSLGLLFYLAVIVGLVLLSGCTEAAIPRPAGTPVVRADDSSTAIITITICPTSQARAQGIADLIQMLIQQDELVVARRGGNARLTINACPQRMP